jgi:hypothetical protein
MCAERSGLLCVAICSIAASALGCVGHSGNALAQEQDASRSGCRLRLIVGLDKAPDEALIGELERASGARLELLSVISPDRLYVLSLSADGPASECAMATERLRDAPLVRSVDVDVRRQHNAP